LLGVPNPRDGSTDRATFTMVRTGGTGTTTYSFSLVHVALVEPTLANSAFGISGAEIHNVFAAALDAKFTGPKNSAVFQGTTPHYDPSSLSTSIDSGGIWLSFRAKAEVTCKPVISVYGKFGLDKNAEHPGLSVRWVYPATAKPEETWCTVAARALSELEHY